MFTCSALDAKKNGQGLRLGKPHTSQGPAGGQIAIG